jgi:hypothetical protein
MPKDFKKVPAIDKCFAILQLLAKSKQALGISEISQLLDLNKSTVFNIIYTLKHLGALEQHHDGKFHFGTLLYLLGNRRQMRSLCRSYKNRSGAGLLFSLSHPLHFVGRNQSFGRSCRP